MPARTLSLVFIVALSLCVGCADDDSPGPANNRAPSIPSGPSPANGQTNVDTLAVALSWSCNDADQDPLTFDVSYGPSPEFGQLVSGVDSMSVTLHDLEAETVYYWKVTAFDDEDGATAGPAWHFSTRAGNAPPYAPHEPSPRDSADNIDTLSVTLSWTGGDPESDPVLYTVCWGLSSDLPDTIPALQTTTAPLPNLASSTRYFWKVLAEDERHRIRQSPTWTFATVATNRILRFPDPNLEAAVRDAIEKPQGDIHLSDVSRLSVLLAARRGISDLTGIDQLAALTLLELHSNHIRTIEALRAMTQLTALSLTQNPLADIAPLADLHALTELQLVSTEVTDLEPLRNLRALVGLGLSDNRIVDLEPLAGLTSLRVLHVDRNRIVSLRPLQSLTGLTRLAANQNSITDLAPLRPLTEMQMLLLGWNSIENIDALAGMEDLTFLNLDGNAITDLSPMNALTKLEYLSVLGNRVADVSPLAGMTKLFALRLPQNQIADVTPLAGLVELAELDLVDNQIADLSGLKDLAHLHDVYLSSNSIVDLSPLSGLVELYELALTNNQIEDLQPLVDNPGIGAGDQLHLQGNPLSSHSVDDLIPELILRGVEVIF